MNYDSEYLFDVFSFVKLKSVCEINNENTINRKWFCGYNCKEQKRRVVNEIVILNYSYELKEVLSFWWTRITTFYCFSSVVGPVQKFVILYIYESVCNNKVVYWCGSFFFSFINVYMAVRVEDAWSTMFAETGLVGW